MSAMSFISKFIAYSGLEPIKAASRDAEPFTCPAVAGCSFLTIFNVILEPDGLSADPDSKPSNLSPDLAVTTMLRP